MTVKSVAETSLRVKRFQAEGPRKPTVGCREANQLINISASVLCNENQLSLFYFRTQLQLQFLTCNFVNFRAAKKIAGKCGVRIIVKN